MNKILTAALLLVSALLYGMGSGTHESPEPSEGMRTIVDMAGRTLSIPAQVDTVLAKCMIGTTIAYSLDPDLVAGLNWYPTEAEKEFLDEDYLKLPMLSGWHAGNEGNVEEIIKTGPSVLVAASFNPQKDQSARDLAGKIEDLTNIPVVIYDFRLEHLPETYRFFGELTGPQGTGRGAGSLCRKPALRDQKRYRRAYRRREGKALLRRGKGGTPDRPVRIIPHPGH